MTAKTPIEMMLDSVTWRPMKWPEGEPTDGQPFAKYEGKLEFLGHTLRCFVLSDGTRIIDGESLARFFGFDSHEEMQQSLSGFDGEIRFKL